jgi:hypothetical protein
MRGGSPRDASDSSSPTSSPDHARLPRRGGRAAGPSISFRRVARRRWAASAAELPGRGRVAAVPRAVGLRHRYTRVA